jgi:hypothetical protein
MGNGIRVFIVNEAHNLSRRAVQWMLTALERIQSKTFWIFTTTASREEAANLPAFGDFAGPFFSRVKVFKLSADGLAERFARRAKEIMVAEGLDGQADSKYLALATDCRGNFREMLQRLEMPDWFEDFPDEMPVDAPSAKNWYTAEPEKPKAVPVMNWKITHALLMDSERADFIALAAIRPAAQFTLWGNSSRAIVYMDNKKFEGGNTAEALAMAREAIGIKP